MNKLSRLFLVFLFLGFLVGCKEKPDNESKDPPEISEISRNIELPESGDEVVVSATVISPEGIELSVTLKWTVDGSNSTVPMNNNGSGNVYTGTVTGQFAEGTAVAYTVTATNKNGTDEKSGSYTVAAKNQKTTSEYADLVLNEINGNGTDADKYIELYNKSSDEAIILEDVKIYYNNISSERAVTWTGSKDQLIQPKSFLLLRGRPGDLSTGLSPTQGIVVELVDPEGNTIDLFMIGADVNREASYSRIPDGNGAWYRAHFEGTPGTTNGTSPLPPQKISTAPFVTHFMRDIETPTPNDDVKISAVVRFFSGATISSVVLKWKITNVEQADIAMTNDGNLYSATIPSQAAGSIIEYMLVATNHNDEETEVSDMYISFPEGKQDYSKLRLNEVSGVGGDPEKFYELINIGDEDVFLAGCKIYYNANGSSGGVFPPNGNQGLTWTGNATQVAKAGQLFSLIGRNTAGSFTTGLTAQRILIVRLEDPDGNLIDECIRAMDTGDFDFSDKSFSRIPDGEGLFYFTTPTPNLFNGTSTAGLTLVPDKPIEGPGIDDADYTHLILNEISGEHKYVEIYNSGSEDIPLHGVKLQRNDGASQWTGAEGDIILAGAYRLVTFNGYSLPAGWTAEPVIIGTVNSGISDQQVLKVALVAPSGTPIKLFIRGEAPLPAWQTQVAGRERSYSYSLMTDGSWANAEPTPGTENGAKVLDIYNPGYLTEQP